MKSSFRISSILLIVLMTIPALSPFRAAIADPLPANLVSFTTHWHNVDGPGTPIVEDVKLFVCGSFSTTTSGPPLEGSATKSGNTITGQWFVHQPRGALEPGDSGIFRQFTTDGSTFQLTGVRTPPLPDNTKSSICSVAVVDNVTPVTVSGKCGPNSEIAFAIGDSVRFVFIGDSACTISGVDDARSEIYEWYAQEVDNEYWGKFGAQLLIDLGEGLKESYTTPLGVLKTGAKSIAIRNDYSASGDAAVAAIVGMASLRADRISSALSFCSLHIGVNALNLFEGKDPKDVASDFRSINQQISAGSLVEARASIKNMIILMDNAAEKILTNKAKSCAPDFIPSPEPNSIQVGLNEIFLAASSFLKAELNQISPSLEVTLGSPANILLLDKSGKKVGFNSASGTDSVEIIGASYSGANSEPQEIIIPDPIDGVYDLRLFGTDNGAYKLGLELLSVSGEVISSQTYEGSIIRGEIQSTTVTISQSEMQSEPPQRSEELFCGRPLSSFVHVIDGTSTDDRLVGTNLEDLIRGFAGNDIILGKGGNDCLKGYEGDDRIWGGDGDDFIYGLEGNDKLVGDGGNDVIFGNAGDDRIWGGGGDDNLVGEEGDDKVHGDAGNDKLYGSDGEDYMWGGGDNDIIVGDGDNDRLVGDGGDDRMWGGAGDDKLLGEAGNDKLVGDSGNDKLYGNFGEDMLYDDEGDDSLNGGGDTDSCYDIMGSNVIVNC